MFFMNADGFINSFARIPQDQGKTRKVSTNCVTFVIHKLRNSSIDDKDTNKNLNIQNGNKHLRTTRRVDQISCTDKITMEMEEDDK